MRLFLWRKKLAWNPISNYPPQFEDSNGLPYSGAVLKFYAAGTSTNISLATDNTGATLASSVALNANGYPEVSSNIIIPHVEQDFKISLYPNQSAADSDTGAIFTIDNVSTQGAATDEWQASGLTPTRTADTTFTLSGDQTAEFHVNRRLRLTDSGGTDYATITDSTYSSPTTTVTVAIDSGGALDAGLSAVDLSILSGNNSAVPSLYKVTATSSSIGTDVITLSVNPSVRAYVQGLEVTFKAGGTNTTAVTINVNSAGAKSVKTPEGADLVAGDITTGRMYTIVYDGTDFILVAGDSLIDRQTVAVSGKIASHKNLVVQYATAATVDIDADEVLLEDSAGKLYKAESVNLTANITASGANGLDTGSESSSTFTWYYIWVIYNGTTVSSLLSTSATSPTMPSGYTYKGLVGAVANNTSDDFIGFHQINNEASLDAPIEDVSNSSTGTSANLATHTAPPNTKCRYVVSLADAANRFVLITSTYQTDTTPATDLFHLRTSSTATQAQAEFVRQLDGNRQTRYRASVDTSIDIYTQGWIW
jgi:hypothetical protein